MDEEIPARWTPHELHQFLHRGGIDFGDERLFFVAEDPTAATGVPPCDRSFPSIVGLAATIVKHLHDAVRHLEEGERQAAIARGDMPATGGDLADTDPVARELDVEERGNQLRQLGHVLIVLNDASSVLDGATRHLATPRGLAACAGAEPVLTSQPPCPRVLEEWTCAPPLPEKTADGTDGLLGSMDSQVLCNGDTTLLFAPSSPNWQILEDRELVTFAISLGTAYADGRKRLRASADRAALVDAPEDLSTYRRRKLIEVANQVRITELRLTRRIAFADSLLDHARGLVAIRPRRDRALIDHVNERSGVDELRRSMTSTRQVAADRQIDLRDAVRQVGEAERGRGHAWVERFLLAVAVLAFIDLFWWFFDIQQDNYAWNWLAYFEIVVVVLFLVGGLLGWLVFRSGSTHRARRDEESSSMPPSRPG
jgi:hypothetical protein